MSDSPEQALNEDAQNEETAAEVTEAPVEEIEDAPAEEPPAEEPPAEEPAEEPPAEEPAHAQADAPVQEPAIAQNDETTAELTEVQQPEEMPEAEAAEQSSDPVHTEEVIKLENLENVSPQEEKEKHIEKQTEESEDNMKFGDGAVKEETPLSSKESVHKAPSVKSKLTTKSAFSHKTMSENLMGEEMFEVSSSEPTIYLESSYQNRSDICSSLRSTFPPKSWPSDANLSKDSDVYPQESEYGCAQEQHEGKVKPVKSAKTLNRNMSRLEIQGIKSVEKLAKIDSSERPSEVKEIYEVIAETESDKHPELVESEAEEFEEAFPYLVSVIELPIDGESLQKISFSETLLISYDLYGEEESGKSDECRCKPVFHKSQLFESERIQEMGGMCLNIENADCNLITFCTTQFSCMGTAGASRLLSVVDNGFNLIEEKKTEWHCTHEKKIEKSLHVAKDSSGYVAFRTEAEDDEVQRHRGDVVLKATGDLVLDGGLFALMRYLIISRFVGDFDIWSMHITGDMCRCKFTVGKKKILYINDEPHMTIRIKKELFRHQRYPDVSKTYFLPSGHIVRHRWKGCKYFFHLNPLGRIPPSPIPYPEIQWQDDIMLISKYLDEKQKRRSEIQTYIGDNPEIKSILQDYMLCLLQLKPENVLDFTMEYFTNLFRE